MIQYQYYIITANTNLFPQYLHFTSILMYSNALYRPLSHLKAIFPHFTSLSLAWKMILQVSQQRILMGAVFANFWMNWFRQVLSFKKWTLVLTMDEVQYCNEQWCIIFPPRSCKIGLLIYLTSSNTKINAHEKMDSVITQCTLELTPHKTHI